MGSTGWRRIPCIFGGRCGLDASRSHYAQGMNRVEEYIRLTMSEELRKNLALNTNCHLGKKKPSLLNLPLNSLSLMR